MKTHSIWGKLTIVLALVGMALPAVAAEPKKVIVVTVTTGFRHSSIPTAEKILAQLAEQSGAFTIVDYARQPEVRVPSKPQPPKAPAADADEKAKAKYEADLKKFEAALAEFDEAKAKSAKEEFDRQLKATMQKLSPANLKKVDGVIFANTTGDLPLPDKKAFLDWIRNGGAFVGMHSASDTFRGHKPLDPYVEMIGGEFRHHGAQAAVEALVQDKQHPSCVHLGDSFKVFDEIYLFNGYNRSAVHELLVLDKEPNTKEPGHFPVAWCKLYGKGKVFYTSLGHREDVWDPEWKDRKNPKEVAEAYQKHILNGIKWALGLVPGDATPQFK